MELACLHCPSLNEYGRSEWPLDQRVCCPGRVFVLSPELLEKALVTCKHEMRGLEIIILFVLINLSLNVCRTNIEMGVFTSKTGDDFVQKYAIGTSFVHRISLVKLVSFYTILLNVVISKNLSTMLSENLLY